MTVTKTLINFNAPTEILKTFDRLCRLHGKTRSLVLNELLYGYILEIGQQASSNIEQVRKIDENLKAALRTSKAPVLDDVPKNSEKVVLTGLSRKFSSFCRKDLKPSEVR